MLRNKQYKKLREKYIEQLIDTIEKSSEYQDYIEEDERYREYIEGRNLLKTWGFTILDTYNNKDMNKLIKRFSKLNKEKYQVDLQYRPKRIRDLNYFSLQYTGAGFSSLATIKFLDDKFIREIRSVFTQINNNQAVVEFDISFNKIMDNAMFLEFIKENKERLFDKKFIGFYNMEREGKSFWYSDIYRKFNELVGLAVQSKLMEIAELNFGMNYRLPSLRVINYPQDTFGDESFKDVFLCKTYEFNNGGREQYLITDVTSREGLEMELYFTGNSFSPLSFTNILSSYRMDFYYFLFDRIEEFELNQRMNKYFNESRDKISSKDYKWLVNKIRAINDNKIHMNYDKTDKSEVKGWKAYYGGEETKLGFTEQEGIKKYETIYTECLEYIKVLYSVGKENLIIHLASMTLIATVLGVAITILLSFK